VRAKQLWHAAIHALSPDAPIESFVEDSGAVGHIPPDVDQLTIEGALPAFDGAITWLNSPPLTPAGLRGKVVLVDFWTYTCINWLRTLPYVSAWADKYRDDGVVVIGVHSPEFVFEHEIANVRRAATDMRVGYPIAVDSEYAIWNAFDNHYWPALYIADVQGRIRHHHFGEGDYDQAEIVIQRLLAEAGRDGFDPAPVSADARGVEAPADWRSLESPETYLGYERADSFASPGGATWDRRRIYAAPARLELNQWALAGDWTVGGQAAVSNTAGGRITCSFHARDLHLVLAPAASGRPVPFRVLLDGRAPGDAHGADVDDQGNGVVAESRLYQLVRQPPPIVDRQLEIAFLDPGVEAFVFTFG
jgi:thiol-disulfide isomerase/thioredoxin